MVKNEKDEQKTAHMTQHRKLKNKQHEPPKKLGVTSGVLNMFNPATLFMYVPVTSQEPVIQWLSFVYVLHICFRSFFYINKAVSFLV